VAGHFIALSALVIDVAVFAQHLGGQGSFLKYPLSSSSSVRPSVVAVVGVVVVFVVVVVVVVVACWLLVVGCCCCCCCSVRGFHAPAAVSVSIFEGQIM